MSDTPRVLVLDVETKPFEVYVWGLRDQNVALNQVKEDTSIIAWAAKWLGDPPSKVIYQDLRKAKNLNNDKPILAPLWKLLNEADIVITQNGKNFDCPRINARFIIHGMRPPYPYQHLDTYQIARRVAKFSSNKLEYLTEKLCTKYKKLSHKKFPGQSLWTECLKGNPVAWDEMKKYNIHDVLATEELYLKIKAWTPVAMPALHSCKDPVYTNDGIRVTKSGAYRRLYCRKCGQLFKGKILEDGGKVDSF